MGWTYTNKPKGQSIFEFFKNEFEHDSETCRAEVLDCAVVNLRTAYLACKNTYKKTGRTYVFSAICLLGYASKSYYNFGYKSMDESMGPCEAQCPERILRQLSPVDQFCMPNWSSYKWACKWRKACWDVVNKRKMTRQLKVGQTIKFANPIHFTSGQVLDTFKINKKAKRYILMAAEHGNGAIRIIRDQIIGLEFALVQ